jgi:hypothetical protein
MKNKKDKELTTLSVLTKTRRLLKKLRYSIKETQNFWVSYDYIIQELTEKELTRLGNDIDITDIK